MPKTPEQWLEECSPAKKGGVFKLFLGYAPGVGKTHTMLTEAIRRHSRGEDVAIGVVETHGRKAVADLVTNLEALPRKAIEYKGALFEEMDVDAILARHPGSRWSTNWRTPISRAANIANATKMCWNCWMRASTFFRP